MLDQKLKARAVHRAKIIRGQLEGLIKDIENEVYCPDLLNRSLSIQKSLRSLDGFLLENHLKSHVKHQIKKGDEDKAIKEIMAIFDINDR